MANNKDFVVKNGLQVGDSATVSNTVTASSFSGDGSSITNVDAATLNGITAAEIEASALALAIALG